MIDKILHYSLTNPGTVYDEEAMTALELAGRTAHKVNECIEQVNKNTKELPGMVADDVQRHIDNGDFSRQIDKYAGDLTDTVINKVTSTETKLEAQHQADMVTVNGRISSLARLSEGSTTGDAELADGRTAFDGTVFNTAGDAMRYGDNKVYTRIRNQVKKLLYPRALTINIDTAAKTISTTGADNLFFSSYGFKGLGAASCNYTIVDGVGSLYIGANGLYCQPASVTQLAYDDVLLANIFFGNPGINRIIAEPEILCCFTVDGVAWYDWQYTPAMAIDVAVGCYFHINTTDGVFSISPGIVFFDREAFLSSDTGFSWNYTSMDNFVPGGTNKLVLDRAGNLRILPCDGCTSTERQLMQVWWNADGSVNRIVAMPNILEAVYVNESKYLSDPEPTTPEYKKLTASIFKKVVCCGDSFTAGYLTAPDGSVHGTNEDYAWPYYMAKRTGAEYINCGDSGATTLTWLTRDRCLAAAQRAGKAQAYIIGLGLNDHNLVELGSTADLGQTTETFYSGMERVVLAIRAINPDAFIFICTMPRTDGRTGEYNTAIRQVAAHQGCQVLDLEAHKDLYNAVHYEASGHPSVTGQETCAEILFELLSAHINNAPELFARVPFIPYD